MPASICGMYRCTVVPPAVFTATIKSKQKKQNAENIVIDAVQREVNSASGTRRVSSLWTNEGN